jgi:hypothetical protein
MMILQYIVCDVSGVFIVVDFLGQKLDDYVATLPVLTRVERMGNRSGLIRARLRGKHFVV